MCAGQASAGVAETVGAVKLAELHLHLDGAVEPATLLEIDPSLTLGEIVSATAYTDFAGFLRSFVWVNKKLQQPEHYALVARRLFERLEAEGVVYAEVTLSAGVILWKQLPFAPIFDALQSEAARTKLGVRWIFDAIRQFGPAPAAPVFELAAERVNDGVVAIGLGGDEERGPAPQFKELFQRGRDRGLHLLCHAGETNGESHLQTTGPRSIWDALEIGAERIGHGIRALEDPRLVAHLAEKQIPLEVCITSNVRTGAVASFGAHPVRKLYDAGVPIILNTDDPALFECTLTGEYALAAREFGFTETELAGLAENAFRHAFDQRLAVGR